MTDGLDLSPVETNKMLRKLKGGGLHRIANGRLFMREVRALVPWRSGTATDCQPSAHGSERMSPTAATAFLIP